MSLEEQDHSLNTHIETGMLPLFECAPLIYTPREENEFEVRETYGVGKPFKPNIVETPWDQKAFKEE